MIVQQSVFKETLNLIQVMKTFRWCVQRLYANPDCLKPRFPDPRETNPIWVVFLGLTGVVSLFADIPGTPGRRTVWLTCFQKNLWEECIQLIFMGFL